MEWTKQFSAAITICDKEGSRGHGGQNRGGFESESRQNAGGDHSEGCQVC